MAYENINKQSAESVWDYCKRVEADNYHLKNQLSKKNKKIDELKKEKAAILRKYKPKKRKPRYRNNGKGGK